MPSHRRNHLPRSLSRMWSPVSTHWPPSITTVSIRSCPHGAIRFLCVLASARGAHTLCPTVCHCRRGLSTLMGAACTAPRLMRLPCSAAALRWGSDLSDLHRFAALQAVGLHPLRPREGGEGPQSTLGQLRHPTPKLHVQCSSRWMLPRKPSPLPGEATHCDPSLRRRPCGDHMDGCRVTLAAHMLNRESAALGCLSGDRNHRRGCRGDQKACMSASCALPRRRHVAPTHARRPTG